MEQVQKQKQHRRPKETEPTIEPETERSKELSEAAAAVILHIEQVLED